jgi:hypothetical protein
MLLLPPHKPTKYLSTLRPIMALDGTWKQVLLPHGRTYLAVHCEGTNEISSERIHINPKEPTFQLSDPLWVHKTKFCYCATIKKYLAVHCEGASAGTNEISSQGTQIISREPTFQLLNPLWHWTVPNVKAYDRGARNIQLYPVSALVLAPTRSLPRELVLLSRNPHSTLRHIAALDGTSNQVPLPHGRK